MSSKGEVLGELIKAKENIKRKYTALKNGKADIQSFVSQAFQPIIEPLNKLQTVKVDEGMVSNTSDDRFTNFRKLEDQEKDKVYGPKKNSQGIIKLGTEVIHFRNGAIIVRENSYPMTQGLGELLCSRYPMQYTANDLITYKDILIQTSAHLTQDGTKIRKGGTKYEQIISKLFTTGSGVKLQTHNLVYWNDPNELVERLRLLLASQAAGNTGLSNEILSIYEELYETGLIKRIPNV